MALAIFATSLVKGHPQTLIAWKYYRRLLTAMDLPADEIERRVRVALATSEPLKPITPDVERSLGPAKSVKETLAKLDRQYKTEGKPAVYFLPPDQPIAAHLDELLKPDGDVLNEMGVIAFQNGAYGDAVVRYEEAIKLHEATTGKTREVFTIRMNRAAALRELGKVEPARDQLRRLLPDLAKDPAPPASTQGRFHYHLALCHWRLGDREAAQREAEESLKAYSQASDKDPVPTAMKEQTQQLLADLKENKPPPPLAQVDAATELKKARVGFQAREALAKLPLDQPTAALLDQLLRPAKSVKETLTELDRQYKEQGKPAVYFLRLSEPIAPHLDELLGPAKSVKETLAELDRQYKPQGKPAVYALRLSEPIGAPLRRTPRPGQVGEGNAGGTGPPIQRARQARSLLPAAQRADRAPPRRTPRPAARPARRRGRRRRTDTASRNQVDWLSKPKYHPHFRPLPARRAGERVSPARTGRDRPCQTPAASCGR